MGEVVDAGAGVWNTHTWTPLVVWASSQHDGWISRAITQRGRKEGNGPYCLFLPSLRRGAASLAPILMLEVTQTQGRDAGTHLSMEAYQHLTVRKSGA